MRIGIDARMYGESGIGRYIGNLISHLGAIDQKNEYFILLRQPYFENLTIGVNFTKVLADFGWYGITEQIRVPQVLKKYRPDIVHFPHFNVPIFYKGNFVVTIHDLIHQHYSMKKASTHSSLVYKIKHFSYMAVFKNAIKKSKSVFAPSYFVKNQLKEWGINEKKVLVTYEGVDEKILTKINKISKLKINDTLKKFKITPPFLFYVGNAHPHKNVEGLIQTFLDLKQNYQYLQLVLSGGSHYFWDRLKLKYNQKDIVYTGKISDDTLVALYSSAQCFIMPSLEEGFGIPILEAMAAGCPVASSNKGALPEVGDGACVYFDPLSQNDMSEKITNVLNSTVLRKQLIREGLVRYKQFSWRRLAQQTLEAYK